MLGLLLASGLGASATARAAARPPRGLVVPRLAAPDLELTDTDGKSIGLPARLHGRVSAVHLMFAGCSSTCPLQGAMFGSVARRIDAADVTLLSVTIDPLGDSPKALRQWLERFGRNPNWTAVAPRVQDVETLATFLRGLPVRAGTHSSQVFLFDRESRLAFRTVDMPAADHVVDLLEQLRKA